MLQLPKYIHVCQRNWLNILRQAEEMLLCIRLDGRATPADGIT